MYATPKDYFQYSYFEVLDAVRKEISCRYDQEAMKFLKYIESILFEVANLQSDGDIHVVIEDSFLEFYRKDLDGK